MIKKDYSNIWVYAQTDGGVIMPSFYELVTKASALATERSSKVAAVVIGSIPDEISEKLKESGVDAIYTAEHCKLDVYNSDYFSIAMAELIETYKPEAVFITATSIGAEIAPTVACKVKTGLVAHAVNAYIKNGEYVLPVPAFGGRCLSEELILKHRPVMGTFKSGIFEAEKCTPIASVEVVHHHVSSLDNFRSKIVMKGKVETKSEKIPVDKADVIVCGGLGASDEETWGKLEKFADAINGVVGHTRPIVDVGIRSTEESLIGTSGKSTNAKVYIGFGVSGASHHLFGMKNSKLVIAVNTDERADIFNASDVKVVADCDAVLTELLKELKAN